MNINMKKLLNIKNNVDCKIFWQNVIFLQIVILSTSTIIIGYFIDIIDSHLIIEILSLLSFIALGITGAHTLENVNRIKKFKDKFIDKIVSDNK